jgi:hypothetical protein
MSVFLASTPAAAGGTGSSVPGHPGGWRRWVAASACLALAGAAALQPTTASAAPGDEAGWIAFVDANGDVTTNSTVPEALTLTSPTGSGTLKRIADGTEIAGVQVAASRTDAVTKSASGTDAAAGTDASTVFGGVVDLAGQLSLPLGNSTTLAFTGLDPDRDYTLVTTANRDRSGHADRQTTFALQGAADFTNASSTGTQASADGSAITFSTGYNTVAGYVARWTGVEPGPDGEIRLASTVAGPADDAFGAAAVMLQLEPVVADTTPPVITLTGDDELTIAVGSSFTDPGATATDNVDGNLTSAIVVGGSVNTAHVGTYHLTYDVTDAAGNHATQRTRTVHVVDAVAPVITLLGDAEMTVAFGATFTDPGATATDNADGTLTAAIVVTGTVDTSHVGTYHLTYDVTDAAGNHATQRTRTVHVVDAVAPVITLLGEAELTVAFGATFTDPGATAVDNADGTLTAAIVVTGTVDTRHVGTYELHYTVSDSSGNRAIQRTRTVHVIDTVPPVITLLGDPVINLLVGDTFADPGATARDNADGILTAAIVVGGTVTTAAPGTHHLTYDVTDSSGNDAVQVTRTVHVGLATLSSTPVPTIEGNAIVGADLTAQPGTWEPAPVQLAYQWYRGSDPIAGATKSTYRVVPGDRGFELSVKVTGSKDGFGTESKQSLPTATVPEYLSFTKTPTPTVSGKAQVGRTLTAKPGTWQPAPDDPAYQWLRNGVPIPGADARSYEVTATDLGQRLAVEVTASAAGYEPVAKASKPTAKVKAAALTGTPKPVIKGKARVGETLTANPKTWGPGTVDLGYRWYRNGKLIAAAPDQATYTVVAADKGKRITVKVTGSRDGYTSVTKTSARSKKVAAGVLIAPPVPEVVGDPMVGAVLQVDTGMWGPVPVDVAIRWLRSGKSIKGATEATYTLTAADLGKRISVQLTATKPGYKTRTQTTGKTAAVIAAK